MESAEPEYTGPERRETLTISKRSMYMVLGVLIFAMMVGLTTSIGALVIAWRVDDNSSAIQSAGYETCVRGNGVRAELQFRSSLTPPEVANAIIKKLGLPADLANATSIQAVRARLPIYDCNPLLKNRPAVLLTPKQQKVYVEKFAKGEAPLPPP